TTKYNPSFLLLHIYIFPSLPHVLLPSFPRTLFSLKTKTYSPIFSDNVLFLLFPLFPNIPLPFSPKPNILSTFSSLFPSSFASTSPNLTHSPSLPLLP
ncbi:hypothetical protein C7212DRAFT_321745, partial [Tuber magnatum]